MGDVTRILSDIEGGDSGAAEQLLPLIYDELRRLAAQKMAGESPDHTLQATALVHEAYLRLVDVDQAQNWNGRGHFYAAAAEAMRRILVESARRKQSLRLGGDFDEVPVVDTAIRDTVGESGDSLLDILDVDFALQELERHDPAKAEFVKLRFFAGLTSDEAAAALGVSRATGVRYWCYARAWMYRQLGQSKNF